MTSKQALVMTILNKANSYHWTLQGLGMLRLYLSVSVRLHIWSPKHAVPNVSIVHTHPWDFKSEIVCGQLLNITYHEGSYGMCYYRQTLKCGEGGGLVDSPKLVMLRYGGSNCYNPGDSYSELGDDIHSTEAKAGTVTLVTRKFKEDTEHARVYWDHMKSWVSAEPRKATEMEVEEITTLAMSQLIPYDSMQSPPLMMDKR